jgi:methylmalonyl-CoA mutase N-terminal domain/subunit
VPRIGAFFDGQINVFEMAAKLRVARRIWAAVLRKRFGAKDPRSWQLPIHVQTSGVELTRQVPHLNIARVALQALGAVLGGCNSLHADSWDEAICIPSEEAALIALLTQHVISEESGVADVIDPLGGSYYFEALTDEMESEVWKMIEKIDSMGGMKQTTAKGWVFNEITKSATDSMLALNNKERIVVGVNEYVRPEEGKFESPKIDKESVDRQIERTKRIKKERDQQKAVRALDELRLVADGAEGNLFEKVMGAVQASCTRGEIVRCLLDVFGRPSPPSDF